MEEKFLVVCNGRTGSTWLTTMLGCLDDVLTDYEFKYDPRPRYEPKNVHRVLYDETDSCRSLLDDMANGSPIVGSKLVLDPHPHDRDDYQALQATIEEDIKIIHLHRRYEEILVSWVRPSGKMAERGEGSIESESLEKAIRKEERAGHGRLHTHVSQVLETARRYSPGRLPTKLMYYAQHAPTLWRSIKNGTLWLPLHGVRARVPTLVAHDLWIRSLAQSNPYRAVAYRDIEGKFPELVRWLGSDASKNEIQKVLKTPPTSKVTKRPPNELLENFDEVESFCRSLQFATETISSDAN